ncbi:MAG: TonB-dependent receptor [Bacteroidota bacterium]
MLIVLLIAFFGMGMPTPEDASFIISGSINSSEDGESVSFSYVHLEELNRSTTADANGFFEIKNVPKGKYTISFHRIGYQTLKQFVEIDNADVTLTIRLRVSTLSGETIQVIGENNELTGANLGHASKSVSGSDLRRNLGTTLGSTLANIPGIEQRTLGSAPSRPVIRGLGDERILILQDGLSTGDISDQTGDHSVTVDPIASSEIEIAKGAAALAYGANAVGGVVNVVNNLISTTLPSKTSGTLTLGGGTVDRGGSGALNLSTPYKNFVVNTHLNGRLGGETRTPEGVIENTQYATTNNAIGVSYVKDWGYIGGSLGHYISDYGIPPDPRGHPSGVDLEMRKFTYALKGEYILRSSFIKTIEADFILNNYNHREFESSGSIGTDFGLVTSTAQLRAKHGKLGWLDHGTFGIWGEFEDYAVIGAQTPDANSYKLAGYLIEEKQLGGLRLEGGLRFDFVRNTPVEDDPTSIIGDIRTRDYTALSSSISAIQQLGKGFSIGTILMHSFRAPSLEELYSEGPHLATFTFEIGNPDLEAERGFAKELFTRWQGKDAFFEVAVFHNDFSNYLFAQNTGRRNNRFPTLNNFQFLSTEALLYGFEVQGETELVNHLVLGASASFTIGERDTTFTNANGNQVTETRSLPFIPPFKANASLTYNKDGLEIGSRFTYSAEQERLGIFESRTPEFFLVDVFAQYRFTAGSYLHTISLRMDNVLNEEYINHLSIIKDLNLEPGRNVSLLYRLYF